MDLPGSPSQSPVLPRRNPSTTPRDQTPSSCNRLGRYLITGRLGEGGMGVVYEAEDTLLKRRVAIKLLPREVAANPEALRRFLREGQAAAKLNHPHVVAVYDIGETNGTHYIVMELVKGGSAQDFLRSRGPFHWAEATSILMDVCRGAAAAHQAGLIHRDIKPSNILRSTEGVVKLGDFGLVKPAGRKGTVVTALGGVVGTPHYMSPEQGQSSSVDERSDIYSLGATYFALLTGRPPYQAADSMQVLFAHRSQPIPDPRNIASEIPEPCTAIIRKAMAKYRTHRHASANELLAELEQVLLLKADKTPGGATDAPLPSFAWSKANGAETTNLLSFADAYPGERTEGATAPTGLRWKLSGLGLLGLLVVSLFVGYFFKNGNGPAPKHGFAPTVFEKDDWPSVAAAADNAIHRRHAAAMKSVSAKIKVLQKGPSGEMKDQQEAMLQTLAQVEKALAFRERISEKGLVLGLDGLVTSVVFSPDDRWLGVGQGSGDAGALVWDSHTGEKRFTIWPRKNKVMVKAHALAFSHDSTVLAGACGDLVGVKLWRLADGQETNLPVGTGVKQALTVAFSPSTRNLVAGFEPFGEGRGKPYLKIWNIDTLQEPFPFKAEHTGKIRSVAFSTGGEQVATGGQDKRVILWNAATGRIWRELHTGTLVQAIACAPQGRMLAVAGQDKGADVLQIWDYAGERLLATKPSPHGTCGCLAFNRDGTLLASGSGSKILLWNPDSHVLLATLEGHSQDVTSLAFSAEGGILATGSNDQTMRLWDVTRFLPEKKI